MFNKFILIALVLFAFTGQSNAQSQTNLEEINKSWEKFYMAFDSLDYKPMAEIHSKELVRISGGKRILDYESYINNYKVSFENAKNNKVVNDISLRFFERINNDSIASERGIYKLIRVVNKQEEQIYYGQFHVLFKKEDGMWRIVMDYDSNEDNTISEEDFLKAHAIDDLEEFVQN